jgi:hypothetical protein
MAAAAAARLNLKPCALNNARASGRAAMRAAVLLRSEETVDEARKAYWVMNPILPA